MAATLRIPHAPLSDAEWASILPFIPRSIIQRGRPCDLRAHFDAIFRVAATDGPWRELPEEYGKAATISRHFRRLTHAGVWERLLLALACAHRHHVIYRLEGLICRATRRAVRLRGLGLIIWIRRLHLKRALPGPPWMVADPILSETLLSQPFPVNLAATRKGRKRVFVWIKAMKRCLTVAAGRKYIPRDIKAVWL